METEKPMQNKSTCAKFQKVSERNFEERRSKSDDLFEKQYRNAPKKIFMGPPCEEKGHREDPMNQFNAACDHAIYVLDDRFYEDLIPRQLLAIDKMIELQGAGTVRVEQVKIFSMLLKSLLSKFSRNLEEAVENYSERIKKLLEIAGRKIESPSVIAFKNYASDLFDLYDTIGSVLKCTGKIFCRDIMSVSNEFIFQIVSKTLAGSNNDFTVNSYKALMECSLIPAVVCFSPCSFDDWDLATSMLGLLSQLQEYFPESIPIMLRNNLVEYLSNLLCNILRNPCEVTCHRKIAFLASGLFLKISALEKFPAIREEVQEAFASEKVIRTIHKACRRYCATVHDTDREIRNSFAAVLILMIRMANSRLNLAYNLVEFGIINWCLQASTRPETNDQILDIKNLRIQMHPKDAVLKQILLQASAFTAALQSPVVPLPENQILISLLYYLLPYHEHPSHFWTQEDFESHRIVALEVLDAAVCYLRTAWKEQNANKKLISLLKRIIDEDPTLFSGTRGDYALIQIQTLMKTVRIIQTILLHEQTSSECCLNFCIENAGINCLFNALDFVVKRSNSVNKENLLTLLRDVLSTISHVCRKFEDIRNVVYGIGGATVLKIFRLSIKTDADRPGDSDFVRCLFSSVAIWIVGNKDMEMKFLEVGGADRLMELLLEVPLQLKADLVSPLEETLRRSYRITKYLEYYLKIPLLNILIQLWNENIHRNILHAILKVLRSCWNWDHDEFPDFNHGLLTDINRFVIRGMEEIFTRYLEANSESKFVLEEVRKLVLVLHAGGEQGLTMELKQAIHNLGVYSEFLEYVLVKSFKSVTRNDPYMKPLTSRMSKSIQ